MVWSSLTLRLSLCDRPRYLKRNQTSALLKPSVLPYYKWLSLRKTMLKVQPKFKPVLRFTRIIATAVRVLLDDVKHRDEMDSWTILNWSFVMPVRRAVFICHAIIIVKIKNIRLLASHSVIEQSHYFQCSLTLNHTSNFAITVIFQSISINMRVWMGYNDKWIMALFIMNSE